MVFRTLLLLALVASLNNAASAQEKALPAQNPNDASSADKGANRPDSKIMVGSPEAEMMARHELKAAPGIPRPVEPPHEPKTIIVNRPSAPKQGEEFINTPDNPAKIP